MKKRTLTLAVITLFLFNQTLFAQSNKSAVDYMNQFSQSFNDFKGETWQYLKSITSGKNSRTVDSKRQNLINKINTVKNDASKIGDFQSDGSLKNAVVEYLNLSHTVLKEDYDKILDMEEIAEQSYDNMEAYLLAREKANEKLNNAFEVMQTAQKNFAAKNNITILEGESDKISKKIEKANEALSYYNKIYLIYFRCYKQEYYALDAVKRFDVNGLQQNISSMSKFATEDLEKLKTVGSYSGDGSLIAIAKQYITFYKQEATKDFPAMVDFLIKKDNFEKIQKTFEAKNKKDRTNLDIQQFNTASNEYNQAVLAYNKVNDSTNVQRLKLFELWNQKIDLFLSNHTK